MRIFALVLMCMLMMPHAVAAQPDSIAAVDTDYRFRPTQLIVPVVLTGVGALFIHDSGKGDDEEHEDRIVLDDVFQFVPAAAYLGLGAVGVPCKHSFVERVLAGGTAYIAMAAMTQTMKHLIHEQRPFTEENNSFPSGHAATAFMGAELLRIEYGNYIGAAGYACAVAMGCMRVVHGRHWLNDVVAGAGVGILSARIGYWMLPLYRKWLHLERSHVAAMPYYSPGAGAGMALTMIF